MTSATGAVLYAAPKPSPFVVRGTTATTRLELPVEAGTYDEYRGVLRHQGRRPRRRSRRSSTTCRSRRTCAASSRPRWRSTSPRPRSRRRRSPCARTRRVACARACPTTTSSTRRPPRSIAGRRARRRRRTPIVGRRPASSCAAVSIANTLYHSTGGGATENNENVYTSATGAKVAGVVSYLRGSSDRAPDGTAYDAGTPYATWSTRTYTVGPAVGLVRGRRADRGRDADRARPAEHGRLGPADQRDAHRLGRDEEGVGRGVPVRLQRGPAGRRPDAPEHAVRARADPLTRAILGRDRATRPRCAWAGADGPNPDPLMVAYHDDEWGTPGPRRHRAVRAARAGIVPGGPVVVDDPAQARGLPGRVPRLRPRGRGGVRRGRSGAPDGRCRDRPERRQDRRDGRQRRGVPRRGRGVRLVRRVPGALVPPPPLRLPPTAPAGDIPATTPASDALSADLKKRGFRFVGSTIVYAFMQSVGLVDDHLPGCFRYRATA